MSDGKVPACRWTAALAARPAVTAAALFIAGIVLHPALPHRPGIFLGIALVSAAAAVWAFRRCDASVALLATAIAASGVAAAQMQAYQYDPNDIAHYAGDEPRLARVELKLDEPLRTLSAPLATGRPMPPRQVTRAKVTALLTASGWVPAAGRVLVQIDPPNEQLAMGQTIRALGMLQRPATAMNPGQFDWAAYYREQRVLASFAVPRSQGVRIVARGTPSPLARLQQYVRAKLESGFTAKQSLDHALLRALVLGDRDPELHDVQEQFRRTGTSHHLAISGMHVAVLGGVIFGLCHLLCFRPRPSAWIGMIAVLVYGAVALPSPPVWRSVILCLSVGIGICARRATDMVQLLALSVLAMLVYHPLDLYNAGFQLSFGTVLGLLLLTPRLLPLLRDRDADVVMRTAAYSRPPRMLVIRNAAWRWFAPLLAASVVAWLVSMPLVAFHFSQLNPWAVLASLLLAPVVFLALIGGFLKVVLTMLIPGLAGAWATLAAAPVSWMRHGVDLLAMLPGSDVPLPGRSVSFIVVYYALLLVPLLPAVRPAVKRATRLAPAMAVLLFVLIPLTGGAARPSGDGALRVTALAVGAGQCCVIELPDGRVILLDAGSATMNDPVRKCIAPFLRSRGRFGVDEVWLADSDFDHIGAAGEIVRTFDVPRVVVPSSFERAAEGRPADEALLEQIRADGVELKKLSRGQHVQLGKGVTVEVLWPPADFYSRAGAPGEASARTAPNNSDLVLKFTYARRTILFPADVQEPAQAALLTSPEMLRCDAMLAPHHGSGESTTAAFVAAADPLYIVSSNDRTLTQKQRLFERQIGGRPLFRTGRDGAVTITIDRTGGLTVTPFAGRSQLP